MLNSIDFYKEIFLHVIPVRVIVPCFNFAIYFFFLDLFISFIYLFILLNQLLTGSFFLLFINSFPLSQHVQYILHIAYAVNKKILMYLFIFIHHFLYLIINFLVSFSSLAKIFLQKHDIYKEKGLAKKHFLLGLSLKWKKHLRFS